jgi:hypothetical protein
VALRWLPEAVAAVAVVLAVLGPVLRRGFVLRYDLVFVPDPVLNDFVLGADGGLPRAIPSELVAFALGNILPADVAEKVLLAAALALGCVGAARLAPVLHPLARVAAGIFYVWNPWVYGRLHLGQWAILVAYAALPWVFAAVVRLVARRDRTLRPSTALLGALPLALGGPAMALAAAVLCGPVLVLARRWRALAISAAVLVGLGGAWLAPVLARGGGLRADPDGLIAFSARADTPLGIAGSVLSLGGIWSGNATPPGRDTWVVGTLALLLAVASFAGFWLVRRAWPDPVWQGLVVAAALGTAVAWLTSVTAVSEWLAPVPGATVVRDATRLLAPLALLQAVGLAGLVETFVRRRDRVPLAVLAMLAPLAILPALGWGLAGQLRVAEYPAEWAEVRRAVAADGRDGAVLSLPFTSLRGYAWNGPDPLVDPAQRMFTGRVIGADDVRVGSMTITGENPRSRRVAALLDGSGPLDLQALRAEGVRYVLVQRDQPGAEIERRLVGAEKINVGRDLALWALKGSVVNASNRGLSVACWLGHIVTVSTVLTLLVIPLTETRILMLLSGNSRQEDST